MVEHKHSQITEVFELDKLVELKDGPLLGAADVVRVAPSGAIFVADLAATSQVHEFGPDGSFRRTVGFEARKINPVQPPIDFVISGDRTHILYGRDLVSFNQEGAVVARVLLPYVPHSMGPTNDGFCIAGVKGDTPMGVFCYDSSGTLTKTFHRRETRLDLYRATPNRLVATAADEVYVVEPFAPTLSRYRVSGQLITTASLPDRGRDQLSALFTRPRPLSQDTRQAIRRHMHRFVAAWAFNRRLALIEAQNDTELWALVLYDIERRVFERWPSLNFSDARISGLMLQHIVGSYEHGLIMSGEATRGIQSIEHQPVLAFLAYAFPSHRQN